MFLDLPGGKAELHPYHVAPKKEEVTMATSFSPFSPLPNHLAIQERGTREKVTLTGNVFRGAQSIFNYILPTKF